MVESEWEGGKNNTKINKIDNKQENVQRSENARPEKPLSASISKSLCDCLTDFCTKYIDLIKKT